MLLKHNIVCIRPAVSTFLFWKAVNQVQRHTMHRSDKYIYKMDQILDGKISPSEGKQSHQQNNRTNNIQVFREEEGCWQDTL